MWDTALLICNSFWIFAAGQLFIFFTSTKYVLHFLKLLYLFCVIVLTSVICKFLLIYNKTLFFFHKLLLPI
ncbi:hypothetical protein CW304_04260 [Bacillus sp. UFRGS-B20]|nr:hypothetical protein CW304_04260 [Bacillus sp. UFRGS-B20]